MLRFVTILVCLYITGVHSRVTVDKNVERDLLLGHQNMLGRGYSRGLGNDEGVRYEGRNRRDDIDWSDHSDVESRYKTWLASLNSGPPEEFDFALDVFPNSDHCERQFVDMDQIMTAMMRVGFQDLDVYFYDLEETASPSDRRLLGGGGNDSQSRELQTRIKQRQKKRYEYSGHACRRCKNGGGKRRKRGVTRKLLDEQIDEQLDDPLDYVNIGERMTEATLITVVDTFASDPMSCLGRGRPPEIGLNFMNPAGSD
jgi:hypothetical protein